MKKIISGVVIGGVCFVAGKYYGYWNVKRLLDSDHAKREITKEFNKRFNEFMINKNKD